MQISSPVHFHIEIGASWDGADGTGFVFFLIWQCPGTSSVPCSTLPLPHLQNNKESSKWKPEKMGAIDRA